jgi:hypothetical protein
VLATDATRRWLAPQVRRKRVARALVKPPLELPDWDEPTSSAPNDPEFVHHVLLEEIDADTQSLRRLRLRESQPRYPWPSSGRLVSRHLRIESRCERSRSLVRAPT